MDEITLEDAREFMRDLQAQLEDVKLKYDVKRTRLLADIWDQRNIIVELREKEKIDGKS